MDCQWALRIFLRKINNDTHNGQGLMGGTEHHARGDQADSVIHITFAVTALVTLRVVIEFPLS